MRAHLSSIYAATTLALLLSTAPAIAEVENFTADLTGAAEVPPNESTGTGRVVADYDTDTNVLKWSISYRGLTGPATAAHFHGPASPDETADPVIPVDLTLATTGVEPSAPPEAGPVTPTEPAAEPAEVPEPTAEETTEEPVEEYVEPPADQEPMDEPPVEQPAEPPPTEPPAAETPEPTDEAAEPPAEQPPAAQAPAEPTETPAEPPAPDVEPAAEPQPGTPTEPTTQVSGEATLTDEQEADLMAGMWYLNIHTEMYPDGELRGQLPPREE